MADQKVEEQVQQARQQAEERKEQMKQQAEEKTKQAQQRAEDVSKRVESTAERIGGKLNELVKPVSPLANVPAKASDSVYAGASFGSIILSLLLFAFRKKESAIFVGLWAPTFLALGLFSKLVSEPSKQE